MKPFRCLLNIFAALCLALEALAILPASPAYAATLTVNTLVDDNDHSCVDDDCSLRDALEVAADGDSITFSVTGTITLSSELPVDASVTINGPGASSLTVSGNNAVRVFMVYGGITVVINNLTIANGRVVDEDGGGIKNLGDLTLNSVIVRDCQNVSSLLTYIWGGGIYNMGTLTINDSEISNNQSAHSGGGIYSYFDTTLTMNNVNVEKNQAMHVNGVGGGLEIRGSATLDNVTISNNHAPYSGGGLDADNALTITNSLFRDNTTDGGGGGLFLYNLDVNNVPTINLTNVTISGNSTGGYGGGLAEEGPINLNLNNVTIANNTNHSTSGYAGGIVVLGEVVNVHNTIIAGNVSNNSSYEDCYGTINSQGHNLIQVTAGCTINGDTTGNVIDQDPLLNALADNGGSTWTHSLQTGSPALDKADNATCAATDQRGFTRPQGSRCDIGAFEEDQPPYVMSITRKGFSPTSASSVDFTVTFNEPVGAVVTTDFAPVGSSGITSADVNAVTGSGAIRTVTVNNISGSGTLHLDLEDHDSIEDTTGNKLGGTGAGNGDFTTGEEYTLIDILTLRSQGSYDGWLLESSETSGLGGTKNNKATTLYLGDDAANKQYRSILSFNTSGIPTDAEITKVTLKVKKSGVVGGGNPVNAFRGFMVDIKQGNFDAASLTLGDFKAAASNSYGPVKPALSGGWYGIDLTFWKDDINRSGNTQVRLRFKLGDNNNFIANYLKLYSGNAGTSSRPQLIVEYYIP